MEKLVGLIFVLFFSVITILIYGAMGGIVFYFVYNPLAPKWLYFIPQNLQVVGFWESIGLFILTGLVGSLIQKLTPTICGKGN